MKPRASNQKSSAMTLTEVLVVIIVVAILALVLLPALAPFHDGRERISCITNLKQIGLACRVWEGDNGDKYPMAVSATNGGAMELVAAGNAAAVFQVMSNELSTPKILICPMDANSVSAENFDHLENSNISYFVNVEVVNEMNPQLFLSGDDNFEIGGVPVKSGLLEVSTNSPIAWSAARHHFVGNIGFADGSVQQTSDLGLRQALQQTGVTNRLAIP